MFRIVKKGQSKYLKFLLVPLIIVGIIGAYVIPQQFTFADEGQIYTVNFYDFHNNRIASEQVLHGNAVNVPDPSMAPAPAGYVFTGWSVTSLGSVTSDMEVWAHYELINQPGAPQEEIPEIPPEPEEQPQMAFAPLSGDLIMPLSAGDPWDLYNFVESVIVRDSNGVPITNGSFEYDKNYTFEIVFLEGPHPNDYNPGQFAYQNGKLKYKLPANIKMLAPVTNGVIRVANGKVIGNYTIDIQGNVEVWFGEFDNNGNATAGTNFIDNFANAQFMLEIDATFIGTGTDEKIQFGTEAEITAKLKYPDPSINVTKTSTVNNSNGTITYLVTIAAIGGQNDTTSVIKVTGLTDMPWLNTNTSINSGSTSAYSGLRYRINTGSWGSWQSVSPFPTWTNGSNGTNRTRFDFNFPGGGIDLKVGQKIEVEFVLDVDTLIKGNYSASSSLIQDFIVGNEVTGKSNWGNDTAKKSDNYGGASIAKKATYNPATQKVSYEISVKAPDNFPLTVTALEDLPWAGAASTSTASKMGSGSNTAFSAFQYRVGTSGAWTAFSPQPTWNDTATARSFSLTGLNINVPKGQTLYITYDLDIPTFKTKNTSSVFGTDIQYSFWVGNTANVTTNLGKGSAQANANPTKANPVTKDYTWNQRPETIDYKVTITNPNATGGAAITVDSFQDVLRLENTALSATSGSGFSDFKYQVSGTGGASGTFTPTWDAVNRKITYTFSPPISIPGGQKMEITYKVDVQEMIKQNPNLNIDRFMYVLMHSNTATVDTSIGSGSAGKTVGVGSYSFLRKNAAYYGADYQYANYRNKISWTIDAGFDYNRKEKLNGNAITDSMKTNNAGYTIELPPLDEIQINFYGLDHVVIYKSGSTMDFKASDFPSLFIPNSNNDGFTFTVPAAGTVIPGNAGGAVFPDIYHVYIRYYTDVPPLEQLPLGGSVDYTNEVTYAYLWAGKTINVEGPKPDDPSTIKNSSGIKLDTDTGKYYIDYSVDYFVPAGHKDGKVYFRDMLWYAETLYGADPENKDKVVPFDVKKLKNLSVAVTPALTAGEPEFKYYLGSPLPSEDAQTVNRLYFFYDPSGKMAAEDRNDAIWPYADAKTITLSFRLYLDDFMMTSPEAKTISEYLRDNPEATIQNWADSRKNGQPFGTTSQTTDAWPIHKSAKVSAADNSVFDYTVYLNYNSLQQLFESGIAVFTDHFDPGLEYVPKSFYIKENAPTARYYGPYGPLSAAGSLISGGDVSETSAVTAGSGSLLVRFNQLNQILMGSGGTGFAGATLRNGNGSTNLEVPNWYTSNTRFEIHYQLKVKVAGDPNTVKMYGNMAEITTKDGETFKSGVNVEYNNTPFLKTMTGETAGTNILNAEVIVNPYGRKLAPPGESAFTAVDKMSENLAFYLNSIELYIKTKNPDGTWGDTWTKQPVSTTPGSLWSVNPISSTEVEFIVPDEQPVKITYEALVNIPAGSSGVIENKISASGYTYNFSNAQYQVTNTSASAGGSKKNFSIIKADDVSGDKLDGAEFKLYMALSSGGYYGGGAGTGVEKLTIGGKEFFYVQTAVPGPAGSGTYIFNDNYITSSFNAVYLVVETKAPTGYVVPVVPDNYTFIALNPNINASSWATLGKPLKTGIADNIDLGNTKIETASEFHIRKSIVTGAGVPSEWAVQFDMYQADAGGNKTGTVLNTQSLTNASPNGTFSVGPFGAPGTHYYIVEEKINVDSAWKVDKQYLVRVTVTGTGALSTAIDYKSRVSGAETWPADFTAYAPESTTANTPLAFVNTYAPKPAHVLFNAIKTAEGLNLAAGQCNFAIYYCDNTGEIRETNPLIQSAVNASAGLSSPVNFIQPFEFTEVGNYFFLMRENNSGGTGWAMDPREYIFHVKVTDTDGVLSATVSYKYRDERDTGTWTPADPGLPYVAATSSTWPTFKNIFTPTPVTTNFKTMKIVSGTGIPASWSFNFEMYNSDINAATGTRVGTAKTATNSGSTVTFDNLTYDTAGTYYYLIKETTSGGSGWTVSNTIYHARVVVDFNSTTGVFTVVRSIRSSANGGSSWTAWTNFNDTSVNVTFTNIYSSGPATLTLTGTKYFEITAGEPASKSFNFVVRRNGTQAATGTATYTAGSGDVSASISFTPITFTAAGTYTLAITESVSSGGWSADTRTLTIYAQVTDNGSGQLIAKAYSDAACTTEITNISGFLTFTNTYRVSPASATINAIKQANVAIAAGQFSFELYELIDDEEGNTTEVLNDTKTNAANGSVAFTGLTFTDAGTYTYKIKETAGSASGWAYDASEYLVTVTVTDNGNGQLSAVVSYPDGPAEFTNIYSPGKANAEITGEKRIAGNAVKDETFTFVAEQVTSANGSSPTPDGKKGTASVTGAGSFTITISDLDPGTYHFRVSEQTDIVGGWTYSTNVFWATVVVSDDGNGGATAVTTISSGTDTFTNTYTPGSGSAEIAGEKSIEGTEQTNKIFTFKAEEVTARNGDEPVSGGRTDTATTQGADGFSFSFDNLAPGTYYFRVYEVPSDDADGWTYDGHSFWATVLVTDNGDGSVDTSVTYDTGSKTFNNVYTPGSADAAITGSKALNGIDSTTKVFTFIAEEVTEQNGDELTPDGMTGSATTTGADEFTINITDLAPGTYFFKVKEDLAGDGSDGWSYDTHEFWATVTVTNNGDGTSSSEVTYDNGSREFINTYTPGIASAAIQGTKSLTGISSTDKVFKFIAEQVTEQDGDELTPDGMTGSATTNGADSFTITFSGLAPGTYYFKVSEDLEGDGKDGWAYDDHSFWATITVTDNGQGTSASSVAYDTGSREFINRYTQGNTTATLEGSKALTGIGGTDKVFTFKAVEVTEENGDDAVTPGGKTGTATTTGADDFAITITGLVPGTYFFKISEDQSGAGSGGWAYDDHSFWATVTVTDNGDGTSSSEVTYDNGSRIFNNKYTPGNTNASITGTKSLTGIGSTDKVFTFRAEEVTEENGDEAVSPGGKTGTATTTGAGGFTITITGFAPGTYFFRVSEDLTGDGSGGWTYDDHSFWATVTVTDNGDGTSSSEVTYDNGSREFINDYLATPASLPISGSKTGNVTMTAGQFGFTIYDGDGTIVTTGTNTASGAIAFDMASLSFEEAGLYEFTVSEDTLSPGWSGSGDRTFYVNVVDNFDGTLTATAYEDEELSEEIESISAFVTFTNAYSLTPTILPISGTKTANVAMTPGQFSFTIMEDTAEVAVGTNDALGNIVFTPTSFRYTAAGQHVYTVSEDTLPTGWTGIGPFTFYVNVTDNGDGTLTATAYEDDEYLDEIAISSYLAFTNNYAATGYLDLMADKDVTGRELTGDDVFSFTVYNNGDPIATGTNDEDGVIVFTRINYTLSDVGSYTYYIYEDTDLPDGWTADSAAPVAINVTVADNGFGQLSVQVTDENGDPVEINFANTYNALGELTLTGLKLAGNITDYTAAGDPVFSEVEGFLEAGQYTFTITDEDDNVVATGKNDALGIIAFLADNGDEGPGPIKYDLAMLEGETSKLFTYTITEDKTGFAWLALTEPVTIYALVEDKGDGTLEVTVYSAYDEETGTGTPLAAADLTFNNAKWYDAALTKWVSDVMTDDVANADIAGIAESNRAANANVPPAGETGGAVKVNKGDYIEYTIRVFNQSPWPLIVTEIVDNVPAGLGFSYTDANGDPINAGWRTETTAGTERIFFDLTALDEVPVLYPDPTLFEDEEGYEDFDFDTGPEGSQSTFEITVLLKVTQTAKAGKPITNSAMIVGITDIDGNDATDIDSEFDQSGLDDISDVIDNDIKGNGRKGGDRDEHDIAIVYIEGRLSVEVHKDTIKRTSAAFDGSDYHVKANGELIDNVETEQYRYDINFRSTSNVDADEFVVEDPLEAVHEGLIRLEGLWTPAVWGDMDGKYNIWYQDRDGTGYDAYNDFAHLQPVTRTAEDGMLIFPTDRSVWKLWTTISQDISGSGVIGRVNLGLPAGLADTDTITALRFEFGAVKVGFTSNNGAGKSQNKAIDGSVERTPYRFTNGSLQYYGVGGMIEPLGSPTPALQPQEFAALWGVDMEQMRAFNAFAASPFSALDPAATTGLMATQSDALGDIPPKGTTVNWTPVDTMSNFPPDEGDAGQLTGARTLRSVTYMVSALIPLDDEDLVSSASAFIALNGALEEAEANAANAIPVGLIAGGLYDQDQDAVLTRVIVPFTANPEPFNVDYSIDQVSFFDQARLSGLEFRDGVWYDSKGRRVQTGDMFALTLWIVLAALAVFCVVLFARTYFATAGKRDKKSEITAGEVKGGGHK